MEIEKFKMCEGLIKTQDLSAFEALVKEKRGISDQGDDDFYDGLVFEMRNWSNLCRDEFTETVRSILTELENEEFDYETSMSFLYKKVWVILVSF